MPDTADTYIKRIDDLIVELDPNNTNNLKLQIDTNFSLAEYYRQNGEHEKADAYIQKTCFVTEDAWMLLGPFDNAGGIGFDTAYIPEDMTAIDLTTTHDGQIGPVRWKNLSDRNIKRLYPSRRE